MQALAGVYRSGKAGQPPVLLLHSSQSNSGQWRSLVAALQQDYEVLAVDLLGYGNAPAVNLSQPEVFRFSDELPRIEAAVASLATNQPMHLIGHSYGAALALKIAREQPFAVASAALFEPVAFHLLEADDQGRQQVEQIAQQMVQLSPAEATAAFVDYWNYQGFFAALPARVQQGMVAQNSKVIADFAALMGEPSQAQDFSGLALPVLLLQGQHTQLSAQQVSAQLLQVLPKVDTVTLDCGHMGPLTHSELVNPYLLQFLAAQTAAIRLN